MGDGAIYTATRPPLVIAVVFITSPGFSGGLWTSVSGMFWPFCSWGVLKRMVFPMADSGVVDGEGM